MSKRRIQPTRPAPQSLGRRHDLPRTAADGVREAAAWAVERTVSSLSPSSVFLQSALDRCAAPDHALLRELTLGTLRWLRRIDHVMCLASQRPLESIEPALRAPLRIAIYQLLFLDRIPPHAAVNEGVEQARRSTHRGGAAFANAVLRRIARDRSLDAWPVDERNPLKRLAIEKSHPDFLVERWAGRFGLAVTRRLLDANNRPKPLQLLGFTDRGGRELLAERLIDEGIDLEPSLLAPLGLVVRAGNPLRTSPYAEGLFYVQDEASQIAALIPPPRPGERILDLAAAPGGKAFSLLAAEPAVDLILADVSLARVALMRENLKRLGRDLPCLVADAGRPAWTGPFDRIVLDLPCTGTGTLRKNPELKWRISADEIGRLQRQALRLLRASVAAVAPGGLLIAITCSLEPEENEDVISTLLHEVENFKLEKLDDQLGFPLDRFVDGPGRWRILPDADHDGFTVHVLRRAAA